MRSAYLIYVRNSLLDEFQYRTGTIIRYLAGFFFDYAKTTIWYAITVYNLDRLGPDMVNDSVAYMIIVSAVSIIYAVIPPGETTSAYMRGDLGRQLLYPINYLLSRYFIGVGRMLSALLTNFLPTFCILWFIFRPALHISVSFLPLSLLFVFLGFTTHFLIVIQADLLCFWVKNTGPLQRIRVAVFKFLSGTLMPLWFFPTGLQVVLDVFPFKNMLYMPVAGLLGRIVIVEAARYLGISCAWLAFMLLTVNFTWQRCRKKMESYGG